jgi:hypothetical protein
MKIARIEEAFAASTRQISSQMSRFIDVNVVLDANADVCRIGYRIQINQ